MTSTSQLRDRITGSFTNTVDAVDDLGWDASGTEPVTASLEKHMVDGTCIEVPPGTYLVDDTVSAYGLTNWGIRGTGDSHEDARFIVPKGKAQRIFNVNNGRNVLVENVTFDMFDTWATCIGNAFKVRDGLLVTDVVYDGKTPNEHTDATALLNVYVFDPDGVGILDGVRMEGPSELADYPANPLAVFSGKETKGTLYIRNCRFANRGEHAIYASRCVGDVRIEGGLYKNNQNTHVRISGEGSYVKNATFVWDLDGHPNKGTFQATTGLTFEAGFQGFSGGLVENCEFICTKSAGNSGCLKVDGSHGAVTVRDCTFHVDADDAEPIWVDAPGDSHMIDGLPSKPWAVELENVTVEGAGGWSSKKWHDVQHRAAVRIDGRSGSAMRDSSIQMPNRDGVRLTRGDYTLERVAIDVGGRVVDAVDALVDVLAADDSAEEDETIMNQFEHELSVSGTGEVTHYEIDTSGRAALVTTGAGAATPPAEEGAPGETVTEHDDGSSTLRGVVKGGADTFSFDGAVQDVRITSGPDPTIEVDGTALDLAQFRDGGSGGDGGNDEPSGDGSGDGSGSDGLTAAQRDEVHAIVAELDTDTTRADAEIRAIVAEEMPTKAEIVAAVREALEQREQEGTGGS